MNDHDHGGGSWTLLTGHGHVLVEIARNPHARIRGISPAVGLTECTVQAIVADLEAPPVPGLAGLLACATAQAAAACARSVELQQWTTHVLADARAARHTSAEARRQRRSSASGRDMMQRSEHARLLARLESMPVIEQAKGITMAQSHCGHAQAFGLLRRASQRSNVPVRELAAQIVAKTAQVPPKRARQALRSGEVA